MNRIARPASSAGADASFAVELYRSMLRIRMVEEEIAKRYAQQEMRCPVHLSIGQEATAVGACAALRPDDQIITSHRGHAHYLAKGGDLKAMLAEIYGRSTGCCGGRGGSMHLFDDEAGVLASVPIVGSFIPLGTGAALSYRLANQDRVCIVFLGDGATEEGAFHESVNFAAVHRIPVIFFVENNLYSCYTGLADRQPNRPLSDLARAYGIPSAQVDGNDVLAVHATTAPAVSRARAAKGPTLIVADTYRWREHCGPNYDNDIGYRTVDEFHAWRARCPVESHAKRLLAQHALSGRTAADMADG
ncbi:MAG TPA: thiamine pyrophosphate-dependent dehydrogenase E1 component subunit alpha, partial [Xanthobacteraceae bacterium]|nr:thiamine pyrophosphate-dependent dehydrogenase E1 component subunit alpha [Xanthobacteraceae bacterium]